MIKVLSYDDWIEVYLDGELLFQGHSVKPINMKDILSAFRSVDFEQINSTKE